MENEKLLNEVKYSEWHNEMGKFYKRQNFLLKTLQEDLLELLHFRTPPIVIDDSSWKNAAESFTVALTLTLRGGVRKCNSADLLR